MAGDWIKMRAALTTCPKVAAIARAIGMADEFSKLSRQTMRLLVVGGLHAVWTAVNEHTSDGVMANSYVEDLDDIAGIAGFGKAMEAAGWLEADSVAATLTFPNFDQWNTPAKDSTAAERMRKHREKQRVAQQPVTVTRNVRVTVAPDKTRQDKTREEDIPAAPVPTSRPRAAASPDPKVAWDSESGWTGISDKDRREWSEAFPGAAIDLELAKATAWLRANPTKAGKRNWRRFVVGWLQRCQDRGGSSREPGVRPGDRPAVVRVARPDLGGQAMSDEEYSREKRRLAQQARLRAEREQARRERMEDQAAGVPSPTHTEGER